jgi:hypothetical protein
MRYVGLFTGLLAVTFFVLPGLTAQEKKKDGDKTEAKDKDPDPPKKEKTPVEQTPEHGPVMKTKIISMKTDSAREFTIEVPMPDPQKIANLQMWSMQQMMGIMQEKNPVQRAQRMYQYQMQMQQKQATETVTMKPVDVRATETCKVRMMYPPVQYDDNGNLKKWTQKELTKLKANSKLPGFPAEFDMLKTGQWVEVYLAKPAPMSKDKGPPMKKKKDEDAPDVLEMRADIVMIVIWAEPMGR